MPDEMYSILIRAHKKHSEREGKTWNMIGNLHEHDWYSTLHNLCKKKTKRWRNKGQPERLLRPQPIWEHHFIKHIQGLGSAVPARTRWEGSDVQHLMPEIQAEPALCLWATVCSWISSPETKPLISSCFYIQSNISISYSKNISHAASLEWFLSEVAGWVLYLPLVV